jgi:hypothetical protein
VKFHQEAGALRLTLPPAGRGEFTPAIRVSGRGLVWLGEPAALPRSGSITTTAPPDPARLSVSLPPGRSAVFLLRTSFGPAPSS